MTADCDVRPCFSTPAERPASGAIGFEELVLRCQRRVYRLLYALLRDQDAAESLTQDCFLRAHRGWSSYRGEACAETWVFAIAINLARDHMRSRRWSFWRRLVRGQEALAEGGPHGRDPAASPERRLAARERLQQVLAAVGGLPRQQREVFLLRFVEEMALGEIAQTLGVGVGTVKTQLHRAVHRLRERLGDQP